MSDYGNDVRFGIFPTPRADSVRRLLDNAIAADKAGLEFIGIQDHPYQARFLDTWALLGTVLANTRRIKVFPDVASLPLRQPAVLAKSAASLDVLSAGRFELALGAGAFWDGIAAMGGPRRTPGQAAAALSEAVEVIRLMWSDQRSVRYAGQHYQLDGAHPGPAPVHPIGIWLGVLGPRMLAETGRLADGWVPSSSYVSPEQLPAKQARIDDAAHTAGRDPSAIRRVYNVFGTITNAQSQGFLRGPVDQWADQLTELAVDYGMDTFVFGTDGDDPEQVKLFAEQVAPAVRTAVAEHRRGSA